MAKKRVTTQRKKPIKRPSGAKKGPIPKTARRNVVMVQPVHGSGFWQDFGDGFKKGFLGTLKLAGDAAKVAAPLLALV